MQVIYIMWLRQIKRYLRNKSRIIGALGQPILFLFALGFGFSPLFRKAGAGNYIQFLTPGIIAQSILFTSIFSGIELIFDRQFGFLKETLAAPVSRFEIMVGRTIGGATVAVLQGITVLIISFFAGFRILSLPAFVVSIVFMILIALVFSALGTAIASTMEDFHGFQLIINFLIMPLFFLSGALFPLNNLPFWMTVITNINPLTYGVDGLRNTLIGTSNFSLIYNLGILSVLAVLLFCIGSYMFSKIEI